MISAVWMQFVGGELRFSSVFNDAEYSLSIR